MGSAAKDIRLMLVADGVTESIFVGQEPINTTRDTTVTVFDTGADQDANPKFLIDYPTIQIRVRGVSYSTVYDLAYDIREKLLGRPSETLNGFRYDGIWVNGDIISLGKDENKRIMLVCNYRIMRDPLTGVHRQAI